MGRKRQSKIQWYGETLGADGKAQAPELAPDLMNHLEGLNRGELYICDNEKDPAIFIRTNKNTIVGFKLAPDIETLGNTFLRKDKEDVTSFLIRFLAGVVIGNFVKGQSGGKIDAEGVGELASMVLRGMLQVGTYLAGVSGAKIDADGGAELASLLLRSGVSSANFLAGVLGQGFTLKNKSDGRSYLEVDELFVRIRAFFTELEIKKLSYVGGNFIFSPAGIVLSRVEETETGYKCYFTNDDGSTATENLFRTDDLCLCQTFNIKPGVHQNVKNKRYWRACTAVGNNWFELSKTDCEANSDVPEAGDSVVVLGNKTDAERQNAILISVFGEGSPSITQHNGIKTYSLVGTEKTRISPTLNTFTGEFHFSSGENIEEITTGLNQKVNDAVKTLSEQAGFITAIQDDLEIVKNQVDGAIESWFYEPSPTLENEPAVNWTDDETKNLHLGDLYYDGEGKSYRFQLVDGQYTWKVITDSDIAKALEAAKNAQDTADGKRRVFVVQPTSESVYDVGDLWVNATYSNTYSNDLLRCKTAKTKGTPFSIDHWEKASKYTDDTTANRAIEEAARAAQAANDAAQVADEASNRLDSWAADGTISPTEKPALKDELSRVDADKEQITAGYTKYGLGTPSSYNSAYTAYRAQLVSLTASTPESITIPSDFRTNQNNYYMQRSSALNAIASAAKDYAEDLVDGLEIGGRNYILKTVEPRSFNPISRPNFTRSGGWSLKQEAANIGAFAFGAKVKFEGCSYASNSKVAFQIVSENGWSWQNISKDTAINKDGEYLLLYNTGKLGYPSVTANAAIQIRVDYIGDGTITVSEMRLYKGTKDLGWSPAPEDVQAGIDAAQTAADKAQQDATTAKTTAENAANAAAEATQELEDMSSDNKLSPIEKQETKKEWDAIVSEKTKNDASADKFGVSKTAYGTAYNALSTYITPLLSSLTTTSDIVGTTFRATFKAYYDARTDLLNAIAAKAKELADAAQETADDAAASAEAAIAAAQTAQEDADAAKERLDNWASDSVISPVEKQSLKDEIVRIDADKNEITAGYTRYGLGTPTNYNNAHSAYKASLSALTASSPAEITIPSDFASKQSAYYTQRTAALNSIAAKAKEQVDGVDSDLQGYKTTVQSKFDATDSKITAAVTETKEYTDSAVDGIQIGGRNLFRYSGLDNGVKVDEMSDNRGNHTRSIDSTTKYFNHNSLKVVSTGAGNQGGINDFGWRTWLRSASSAVINNVETITVSFYAKSLTDGIKIGFRCGNNTTKLGEVSLTSKWEKYSITVTPVASWGDIIFWLNQAGTIWMALPKVVYGTKTTDWTPAPEDVSAQIVSETKSQVEIEAGKIEANVTTIVNNKIDNLEIGGRNYILKTVEPRSFNPISRPNFTRSGGWSLKQEAANIGAFAFGAKVKFEGCSYASNSKVAFQIVSENGWSWQNISKDTAINKDGEYLLLYNTGKLGYPSVTANAAIQIRVDYIGDGTITVSEMRLYKGTKDLGWSPAPEDTEQSITALDARIKVTEEGITQSVTKMEFMEEKTNILDSAANTAQQKADAAKNAAITAAANRYATKTTVSEMQTSISSMADQLSLKATKSELDTVKDDLTGDITDLTKRVNTAEINLHPDNIWAGISSKVDSVVGDIQVGGRNLCIGSATKNFAAFKVGGTFNYSITEDASVLSKNIVNIKCVVSGQGFYSSVYDEAKQGEVYTWSFYAKCSVNKTGIIGHEKGGHKQITLTTEWQKFTHTFTANNSSYRAFTWYLNWKVNEILYIHSFKFEKGTKATDWTPAPEDMASKSELVKTGISIENRKITAKADTFKFVNNAGQEIAVFENDRLKTSLIDVNNLLSQNITVSGDATITNLRAKNAVIEGELVGVTGTFLSLRGIEQNDDVTYGEIKFKDYGLEFTGSDIRHNTQVTEDLGDGPQTRTARFMGNIGWFKQELGFGALASLTFDLSYITDVFAYVLPNPLGSNINTSTTKYALPGQSANLIKLYGNGTYTVNICNGLEGQFLMFANHSSTVKYICMTRGGDHWVFSLKEYGTTILYCTNVTNEYWVGINRYVVNDLFQLRAADVDK